MRKLLSKPISIYLLSLLFLILHLSFNFFRTVPPEQLTATYSAQDSLVIGRLVLSNQLGPLSDFGRLGRYEKLPGDPVVNQTLLHAGLISGGTWTANHDQIGAHGVILSFLDRLLPGKAALRLSQMRALFTIAAACCLALILCWIYQTYGIASWTISLVMSGLSPGILLMSGSLFWCETLLLLPLILLLRVCSSNPSPSLHSFFKIFLFSVVGMAATTCCGYGYLEPLLLAGLMILLFLTFRCGWTLFGFLTRSVIFVIGAACGLIITLAIHGWTKSIFSRSDFGESFGIIFDKVISGTLTEQNAFNSNLHLNPVWNLLLIIFLSPLCGGALKIVLSWSKKNSLCLYASSAALTAALSCILWNTLSEIRTFNRKHSLLAQVALKESENPFQIVRSGEVIYLLNHRCNPAFLSAPIDVEVFAINEENLSSADAIKGFTSLVFDWENVKLKTPNLSKVRNICVGSVSLPAIPIRQITIGQQSISPALSWKRKFNLQSCVGKKIQFEPFDKADDTWDHGYRRDRAGLLLSTSYIGRQLLLPERTVNLHLGISAKITSVEYSSQFIQLNFSADKIQAPERNVKEPSAYSLILPVVHRNFVSLIITGRLLFHRRL